MRNNLSRVAILAVNSPLRDVQTATTPVVW